MWAGMEGSTSSKELREKCIKALSSVGASEVFCTFFADVLQCEYDINTVVHRIHQDLSDENTDLRDPNILLRGIQHLTKNYNIWKVYIDNLGQKGKEIPPLTVDPKRLADSKSLTALCSIETKEVNLKEGDEVTILDTSQPNRFKVRTSSGEEGYVPALSCLLPSPDKNAVNATDRLRVQLLTSWTQSVKKLQYLLMKCLVATSRKLTTDWKSDIPTGSGGAKERVTRRFKRLAETINKQTPRVDLSKLHNALYSLEKELNSWDINGTDVSPMTEKVASMDKAVLCFQMFVKQWQLYRRWLEKSSRPIKVVERWEQLRPTANNQKYRYLEVKMTLEKNETVEEISRQPPEESWTHGAGAHDETVETDQITRTSQEERKRFIIRAVLDPRNNNEISIQDAVQRGIVDQNRGLYVNPDTGEGIPIPEAMNTGKILVEFATTTKSAEETKAVGLITIRTHVDRRHYTIDKVIDATTGERLEPEVARKRGILEDTKGIYVNSSTKEKLSLENAIHEGWVIAEYDEEEGEPEFETKTYAVNTVVDQRRKKKVPFYEAVRSGLINKETGNYINNVTGEQVYVTEAIKRGFLKAREIEDASGLDIDAENKVVIQNLAKIRKNVLKSMGVISAFKHAALTK